MKYFQAVYYRDAKGREPVDEFLDKLPVKWQPALDNQIDRLNTRHAGEPHLPFPHSSQIEGELRELRCHYGNSHYRILYRRSDDFFILLHMFPKTTDQVPESEKQLARDRWDDFKERMNAKPRVPPRAMGHDAP